MGTTMRRAMFSLRGKLLGRLTGNIVFQNFLTLFPSFQHGTITLHRERVLAMPRDPRCHSFCEIMELEM